MGCGSSQVGVTESEGPGQTKQQDLGGSGDHKRKHGTPNGRSSKESAHSKISGKPSATDSNANTLRLDQTPVPKSVAFEVTLEGTDTALFPTSKRLPRRLLTLDPLDVPKLSAEQLEEKQRLADEKRKKLLQKRANSSKKASRRRQELLKAKEFEVQQQMEQEKVIDEHQKMAEMKREAKLSEIKDKQRLREEKAKRARERAKKLNNPDEQDNIDVEKDDHFNASDDDSWLGEDGTHDRFSGPQKHLPGNRPTASASTVDSYDAAFQRQQQSALPRPDDKNTVRDDDDFFGS